MKLEVEKIKPEIGYYLAGFADGEGSSNVSFRKRIDYRMPWKVSLCFNISQKDLVILELVRETLRCGTLRGRPDGVWYFEVNQLDSLISNIVPFFDRFAFLSAKKRRDYSKFKELIELFRLGSHLNLEGIKQILKVRDEMNDGGKRKYSDSAILELMTESSETTCQTLNVPN